MRKIIYGLFISILLTVSSLAYSAFYGPTFENEHLYRIALNVRPSLDISVPQMMIAILNANPHAFVQQNINGLKSGYRLRLPTMEEIYQVHPEYASRTVDYQNAIWQRSVIKPVKLQTKLIKHKPHSLKHKPRVIKEEEDAIPSIENSTEESKSTAKSSIIDIANNQVTLETPHLINAGQAQLMDANQKIDNLTTTTKKFEQQATAQITQLQKQTQALQTTVNQLNDQIKVLTYHYVQISTKNGQSPTEYNKVLLESLKQNKMGLIIGVLILSLLTYLLVRSFRPKHKVESYKNEYDFMGSRESIPTKLDLARAYIDMGDYGAAKSALKEVIEKGNEEQRRGAKELLGKMNGS